MKWLIPILLILLAGLQYRLWVGEGSLADVVRLNEEIQTQAVENEKLRERNRILAAEVGGLKSGLDAVEERAREDLGMIKPGETFFMVVEPASK
ncbi:cell division protein FtsB [Aestuariicella hydrocarbonica]|uniref:Cell division protein FtsB n=1 Tax=Pseudomaricurvus hydrocarbonicus TaxID=1470433 RepID=A0A9E5JR30_9GAMM|nr:cell division protein FtsB [Aestuariicella hydrocarbonica]NHO63988.1 cell division protein FtsB [Aestuariicella hydrocarbonica]